MLSTDGIFSTPKPTNEPVRSYTPDSPHTISLKKMLQKKSTEQVEVPCVIDGKRYYTGRTIPLTMPSDHKHQLGVAHLATPELVEKAIESNLRAKAKWASLPWSERASIFLRAAELLAGPWRDRLNATTMLCQAKTCYQAEIDAACELIDFWKFNVHYLEQILKDQPSSGAGVWNRLDYRPLEGFIFAITPFNFTSIALNLPTAPAMCGNVAIWKPSNTQLYSAWEGMLLLEEAGVPPGVINFLPGNGADVGDIVLDHPDLSGLHFTGSTQTFQHLWKKIGNNINKYKTYPRIVGETGGKDFILAHESADIEALTVAILRGAFEFQGQKCSAASPVYVPQSIWPELKARLITETAKITSGDIRDFSNFFSAVIDENAFNKHNEYLNLAKETATIIAGGSSDGTKGWYIEPTIVEVDQADHRLMAEEIFGPIVAIYPYSNWEQTLKDIDNTSPYALTGAVFSQDRYKVQEALSALRNSAGNFYINDKPTGAVVGQQPFGGARGSGTNDKAGSALNLMRWMSPRTIKENLNPPHNWTYPFLG